MKKFALCLAVGLLLFASASPAKADFITRIISSGPGFQEAEVSDGFGNLRVVTMPTNASLGYSSASFNSYSSGPAIIESRSFHTRVDPFVEVRTIHTREVRNFVSAPPVANINIVNNNFRRRR